MQSSDCNPIAPGLSAGRVCTCSECAAWPEPKRQPRMGKYGAPIKWRGKWWGRNPQGYFRHAKGPLLHRAIWEAHRGAIPKKFHVHHIDGDPGNNTLENLALLSAKEHTAAHPARGFRVWTPERRGESKRRVWAAREPKPSKCEVCGVEYESVGMRRKYCGRKCAKQAENARLRAGIQPKRRRRVPA